MVSPSRSSTSRRSRVDAGKIFVGVLILTGLVASFFLVFSDSLQFVRIGLVAALWAAVIGALAATRYRKEATIDKAKVRDLQTVYELQLEREITARREYELGVEARVRSEVGADASELAALRAELTVLRQSLQRLFDGDLPMDRPALHADATRIQELPSAVADPANDSSANAGTASAAAAQQSCSNVTPVFYEDHPEPPMFASPFDEPVTAETSVVTSDREEDQTTTDPTDVERDDNGEVAPPWSPRGWADAFTETSLDSDEEPALLEASTPAQAATPAGPKPAPQPTSSPRPTASPRPTSSTPTIGTSSSRRRRRVDADADSSTPSRRLSVAEIVANLQSEQNGRN
ncbi:DUF6779 domain-containing protein [Nocardia australiensis]|uniref:DUF6779 domain-containing protein n=1 Tax=Nocardia australiensis TaxID=2887191 RepID=UPI001D136670|nr:DUF6779 domain-containing protein [Nocardia australiensis]